MSRHCLKQLSQVYIRTLATVCAKHMMMRGPKRSQPRLPTAVPFMVLGRHCVSNLSNVVEKPLLLSYYFIITFIYIYILFIYVYILFTYYIYLANIIYYYC